MRTGNIVLILLVAALSLLPAGVFARGGGGGFGGGGGRGFSGGGGGFSGGRSYGGESSRGFSDGYGSVRYSGQSNANYGEDRSYQSQAQAPHFDSSAQTQRPMNYGSIQHYGGGQVTRGEYGGAAVSHENVAGGGTAAVRGPEGNAAVVHENAFGGGSAAVRGEYGGAAFGHENAAGGGSAAVRGPQGNAAAVHENALGGGSAAVRGAYGGSAAAWRGPGGARAGYVAGPWGGAAAGVRGPNIGGAVTHLPTGYAHAAWHGENYYHYGHNFYRPYWYGGSVYYWPCLPPIGFWFGSLPDNAQPIVYNNVTYYSTPDGAYYQPAQQDGQNGYAAVEPPPAAASTPSAAAAASEPFHILQRMSDYMAAQKQFQMVVQDSYDEVADSGQKIQLTSTRTIMVQRPDKLAVDFHSGDAQRRRIVYDGKQLTAIDYTKQVYGVIAMPDTLDAALDKMAKDYGMALPVSDLLYTDTFARLTAGVTGEMNFGPTDIDNQPCDHLAFTAQGTNWEIWIQQGDKPLPRKILINYIDEPERPQYVMEISQWKEGAPPATAFEVSIPPELNKIDILPTAPAPAASAAPAAPQAPATPAAPDAPAAPPPVILSTPPGY